MNARLKLVKPCNENRQVMPVRPANTDLRSREYLTPAEIEKLIKAAKDGRWGLRDATLIMVAYRHGLRAVEACELEWSQSSSVVTPRYMCAGPSGARRRFIRSGATSCGC
jgi:type 1 fimbriae regulatory protein FimB/type 1 fimbriae regulatory protein FimE